MPYSCHAKPAGQKHFRFLTSALAAACEKTETHNQRGCALRDRARAGQKRGGAAAARYGAWVIRCVIDASVAAEFLLRTTLGRKIAEIVEGAFLAAPELLDVEVLSVLRRAVLRQRLEDRRARLALDDLAAWPIDRIPHAALLPEARRAAHNVSAYDAFYVAAARLYDAPLLTADGPLSRAPTLGIVVQNIRLG